MCFSGEAKAGPAIGQALGPLGVNMAEFCKQFNAATAHMKPGLPTPCRLTSYADRTFTFALRQPPTVWFLKKCANAEKGSSKAAKEVVARVTLQQVYEIAKIKNLDQPDLPLIAVCRMVAGTAKSMGFDVIDARANKPVVETQTQTFARRGKKKLTATSY
jgi:large subunit ribosomal protein L11